MKLTVEEIDAIKKGLTTEIVSQIKTPYRLVIKSLIERCGIEEEIELFIDGAAHLQSKRAGIGGVMFRGGEELYSFSEYLDDATNNEAEYQALIRGLQLALKMNISMINVKSDSELIVKQINGIYRVKHPNMQPLYTRAMNLFKEFSSWKINHVPREENKLADKLSKDGMNSVKK